MQKKFQEGEDFFNPYVSVTMMDTYINMYTIILMSVPISLEISSYFTQSVINLNLTWEACRPFSYDLGFSYNR